MRLSPLVAMQCELTFPSLKPIRRTGTVFHWSPVKLLLYRDQTTTAETTIKRILSAVVSHHEHPAPRERPAATDVKPRHFLRADGSPLHVKPRHFFLVDGRPLHALLRWRRSVQSFVAGAAPPLPPRAAHSPTEGGQVLPSCAHSPPPA